MNRKEFPECKQISTTTTWIPLASIHPLDARGKTARTHDGQLGTVLYFTGPCVVLRTDGGKEVTVPIAECEVAQS